MLAADSDAADSTPAAPAAAAPATTAQDFVDGDDPDVLSHWALLVAGSAGWGNYRHQADVYHAHQVTHALSAMCVVCMAACCSSLCAAAPCVLQHVVCDAAPCVLQCAVCCGCVSVC